jgi:hypothetical protein
MCRANGTANMQLQTLGGTTFGDMQSKRPVQPTFDRAAFKSDGQIETLSNHDNVETEGKAVTFWPCVSVVWGERRGQGGTGTTRIPIFEMETGQKFDLE